MFRCLFANALVQILIALSESANIVKRESVNDTGTLRKKSAYIFQKASVVDTGTHIEICRQAPIELGIVLDSSSSIGYRDFQTAKSFLQEFLGHFDLGQEGVRVSIITYGKGIYAKDGFNLTTYDDKQDVIDAVGRIPHRRGLYTDTGKAIKYMHEVQLANHIVRPIAQKIALVITDGNSQEWRATKKVAENARNDDIIVFAIGVGSEVRDQELLNIAGNHSRVTKVETYDQLSSIKETLAKKTCILKEKPTTTQPPKIKTCGELNPTDVNFVFSPAALGLEATAWTTSFISSVISAKDLDVGFRYGVISGSCPDDEGFNLDTCSSVDDYRRRLEAYNHDHLPKLVWRVLKDGFHKDKGARDAADKVAVIVFGKSGVDDVSLQEYIQQLVANQIKVFIADPFGSGAQVERTVTLTGGSSRQQSDALISYLCPNSK